MSAKRIAAEVGRQWRPWISAEGLAGERRAWRTIISAVGADRAEGDRCRVAPERDPALVVTIGHDEVSLAKGAAHAAIVVATAVGDEAGAAAVACQAEPVATRSREADQCSVCAGRLIGRFLLPAPTKQRGGDQRGRGQNGLQEPRGSRPSPARRARAHKSGRIKELHATGHGRRHVIVQRRRRYCFKRHSGGRRQRVRPSLKVWQLKRRVGGDADDGSFRRR